MARAEKETAVQELTEIMEKARGVFITDYQGLNVEKLSELRKKCRESSVRYKVVKNTLARLAAKKAGVGDMAQCLEGPSAIAYSFDDPSAPARVVTEFAKKHEKPSIKASLFEGVFYGPDRVEEIANLPPKEVLIARLMGGLNAPIQNLVGALSDILRKLVLVVDAVKTSKEKS